MGDIKMSVISAARQDDNQFLSLISVRIQMCSHSIYQVFITLTRRILEFIMKLLENIKKELIIPG
jgi:hypothetical protein